LLKEDLMKLK